MSRQRRDGGRRNCRSDKLSARDACFVCHIDPPGFYNAHCKTVKDCAGTSNLVLPSLLAGAEKTCGTTRRGAANVFEAFRSSPVSTDAEITRAGIASSHTTSTL